MFEIFLEDSPLPPPSTHYHVLLQKISNGSMDKSGVDNEGTSPSNSATDLRDISNPPSPTTTSEQAQRIPRKVVMYLNPCVESRTNSVFH